MNEGLPTETQLARIEDRVLRRIRRRAQVPKAVATTVVVLGLLAGGVTLIPHAMNAGGSAAGSSGSGASTVLVRCHTSAAAGSASVKAKATGAVSEKSVVAACVRALNDRDSPPNASRTPLTASGLVACRDRNGLPQVFPGEGKAETRCASNGMTPLR